MSFPELHLRLHLHWNALECILLELPLTAAFMMCAQDCGNHRIRQVAPDGEVTTIAGSGQPAHKDGHGRHACFYNPCGVAIDYVSNDVLYVADYSNNCVRAVSRSGLVSTLAKDAETPLDSPYGIAVHIECSPGPGCGSEATVYVSSYHSHSLARITPEGRVSILAGCGAPRQADGHGAAAAFHAPNGLSVDLDGVLYVADSGNHCVRRVSPEGEVQTLAGNGRPALGPASLNSPCGLCVCRLAQHGAVLLIADRSNSCVRLLPIDATPPPLVAPSTMREDLRALLDSEGAVDGEAIFEVEGRLLRAPKAVLCARCPHFRAMFGSGMRESRGEPVVVSEQSYAGYRALLDYLLCDELSVTLQAETLLECMMLANAYGIVRLEQYAPPFEPLAPPPASPRHDECGRAARSSARCARHVPTPRPHLGLSPAAQAVRAQAHRAAHRGERRRRAKLRAAHRAGAAGEGVCAVLRARGGREVQGLRSAGQPQGAAHHEMRCVSHPASTRGRRRPFGGPLGSVTQ